MRIGLGYDLHRLVEGRPLVIGGVDIPFEKGLLGHSDADVLLHAIADAALGAAALGDIGAHFPDTDDRWSGADSRMLLIEIRGMIAREGYRICNVDSTVVLERPKLRPHIDEMRRVIADCLTIGIGAVSVKATSHERMGVVGRGEAAAAYAVCMIDRRHEDSND